jgi:hypothetical protein
LQSRGRLGWQQGRVGSFFLLYCDHPTSDRGTNSG